MKPYTIGQFAKLTGLTRRALRLYEEAGLLEPERGPNNYRRYTTRHLDAARVIKELRESGLSLDMIRALFDLKRSALPPGEKLARSLVLLDRMRGDLLARRRAIDAALERLEDDRREVLAMLEHVEGEDHDLDRA
jgi:DNA-binding transcriptional MerR regulator